MKKLMLAFSVALMAIGLQAATVNWNIELGWVTETDGDNASTLTGYLGYMFDGSTYTQTALQTSLTTTGNTVLGNALGSGAVTADGELTFSGSGLSYDDTVVSSVPVAKALLVLIDSAATDGSAFTIASFADVNVTDAVIAGGANFGDAGDLYTGLVSTWSTVSSGSGPGPSPIPEPTSGLLMLLGVAGLALKRKRA